MKRILGIFVVLLALAIISYVLFEVDGLNASTDPKILAKQSPLIVYATVKRDAPGMPLVIKEVWKNELKTNSPLIDLELAKSTMPSNQMPDGAIVFFKNLNNSTPRTYVFVRNGSVTTEANGKVLDMTLEQYKRSCDLSQ